MSAPPFRPAQHVGRDALLAEGARVADSLARTSRATGMGLLQLGAAAVPMALALRNLVAATVADGGGPETLRARIVSGLYTMRETLGRRPDRLVVEPPQSATASRATRRLLLVPRELNHFRDMIPVARHLRKSAAVDALWLATNQSHLEHLRNAGERAVLWTGVAPLALRDVWRLVHDVDPLLNADGAVPARALAVLRSALKTRVAHFVRFASALRRLMLRFKPDVLLVGNPCTFEGRLAALAGKGFGVASAAVQHGDLRPHDVLWQHIDVERICVWGDQSRKALLSCGLPPDRLAVTGAPWLDEPWQPANKTGRIDVLVATSGAGHSVGLAEHEDIARRLLSAAAETPELRWVLRLHPKDNAELYVRLAGGQLPPNIDVTDKDTIHHQLARSGALITVTSTAALDAMLHRVPVLTLGRPAMEHLPDYVVSGATTHVPLDASLAGAVRAMLTSGELPSTKRAAQRYAESFYGELDQRATERVAAQLASLAGWAP